MLEEGRLGYATPTTGTGSYILDGLTISGTSCAYATTTGPNNQTDLLQILIVNTPKSQPNTRTLLMSFEKPKGQPAAAYKLTPLSCGSNVTIWVEFPTSNSTAILQETSNGVFSGTFSSTASTKSNVLNASVFANAPLQ